MQRMLRDIDDPDRSELLARIEILSPTQDGRSTPVRNTTPMQSCH
jgi:hypothetical protein